MSNKKIELREFFDGKEIISFFDSKASFDLYGKRFVVLRADCGNCCICQIEHSDSTQSYYKDGITSEKVYVKVITCGTTDNDFEEAYQELIQNSKKYV